MPKQKVQTNKSDDESNDKDSNTKDEDLTITDPLSKLGIATASSSSVVTETSHKDTLHAWILINASKKGVERQYEAPIPKIVCPQQATDPVVLCVFLGPSSGTSAGDEKASPDWNAFWQPNGNWATSIGELHKKFPLKKCFLVDAFPLLYWNGDEKPSTDDFEAHFDLGVAYIQQVIAIIKPRFVLSFGRQSSWVVFYAVGLYNRYTPTKKPPIRSWMNDTGGGGKIYKHPHNKIDTIKETNFFFCPHPGYGSRGKTDLFEIPLQALKAIEAFQEGEALVSVTESQDTEASGSTTTTMTTTLPLKPNNTNNLSPRSSSLVISKERTGEEMIDAIASLVGLTKVPSRDVAPHDQTHYLPPFKNYISQIRGGTPLSFDHRGVKCYGIRCAIGTFNGVVYYHFHSDSDRRGFEFIRETDFAEEIPVYEVVFNAPHVTLSIINRFAFLCYVHGYAAGSISIALRTVWAERVKKLDPNDTIPGRKITAPPLQYCSRTLYSNVPQWQGEVGNLNFVIFACTGILPL